MNVFLTKYFNKQLKRFIKRDASLVANLEAALDIFNLKGSISIGKGVYKLRIKAQNKGKSGGYRIYVLFVKVRNLIVPLCIYAKSEKENLNSSELANHLTKTTDELATEI